MIFILGVLKSKHLKLNVLTPDDLPQIYKWETEIETRPLWQDSVSLPSSLTFSSDFSKKLESFYHSYFIISNIDDNAPIGCVYSYGYNRTDGFMHISVFIDRKYRKSFTGAEAGILFSKYLFSNFPIRKLYTVAFAYNMESVRILELAGFQREGTLKKHKYYDGDYYDMYTYAIYREDIEKLEKYVKP